MYGPQESHSFAQATLIQTDGRLQCTRRCKRRYRYALYQPTQRRLSVDVEFGNSSIERPPSSWQAEGSKLIQSLQTVARPFFASRSHWHIAFSLGVTLLGCILAKTWLSVAHSTALKAFMTALQQRDVNAFYNGMFTVARLILLLAPVLGLRALLHECFLTEWRKALTKHLATSYFTGGAMYQLQRRSDIDNLDQRICQDSQRVLHNFVILGEDIASSVSKFVSFTFVLYSISPAACLFVLGYAVLATSISVVGFGPRLVRYREECIQHEASLRYCLVRARENAEAITFFRGGFKELQRFEEILRTLIQAIYSQKMSVAAFNMLKDTLRWATFAFAPLLVGPAYMRGEIEFGAIMQAHLAVSAILDATVVIRRLDMFSALKVQAGRIHDLEEFLNAAPRRTEVDLRVNTDGTAPYVLEIQNLQLKTPASRQTPQHTLFDSLSIHLGRKNSLLVTGGSGLGKSALLRAIAGIWSDGVGSIRHPDRTSLFFLPQKPYMCCGSLREQVLYPQSSWSVTDADVRDALCAVKLDHLLQRHGLDADIDWSNTLSSGEQQRLSFARVLIRKNLRLVLMDEGTSACDPDAEATIYDLLQQQAPSFITVGHKRELLQYHTHVLLLEKCSVQLQPDAHSLGGAKGRVFTSQDFEQQRTRCEIETKCLR